MKHLFEAGTPGHRTLVLLHGTGGNERDLIPVAKLLDNEASILSLRGEVNENGMLRFFRRLAEGVFDEADVIARAQDMKTFLEEAVTAYDLDPSKLTAVGYSNGANMAAAMTLLHGPVFAEAVLFAPMVPLKATPENSLQGMPIFLGAGTNDPIVAPENTRALEELLRRRGAAVRTYWHGEGHRLTQEEVQAARSFLHTP
jgi:phospholipase/carboxylesterase